MVNDEVHSAGGSPSFEYDPNDLWEAITHCVSPTAPIPFPTPPEAASHVDVVTLDAPQGELEQEPSNPFPVPHRCNVRHHNCDRLKPKTPQPIYVAFNDDGSIPTRYKTTTEKDSEGNNIILFTDPSQRSVTIHDEEPQHPQADGMTRRLRFELGRKYKIVMDESGDVIMRAPEAKVSSYMYAEHCLLGNDLHLKWEKDLAYRAEDKKITLENGYQLTYGQINGLGGDFFGTYSPICTGKNFQEQCDLFLKAYGCLSKQHRTVKELDEILKSREQELKAVGDARRDGTSTFEAYKKLSDGVGFWHSDDAQLQLITKDRDFFGEFGSPGFMRLAQLNLDHFGFDAHIAYNAGHYCALREAANGDLNKAYGMNAFADHYLGDCFAAGHIRTPRRFLHASEMGGVLQQIPLNAAMFAKDMCSKYMHDEDNALGLLVQNRNSETWKVYGDKKMFEPLNDESRKRLTSCLQASADEIFACFTARKIVVDNPDQYAAWYHAPVLDAALDGHNHSPLFTREGHIRDEIDDQKCWKHAKVPFYRPWASVYSDLRTCSTFKQY